MQSGRRLSRRAALTSGSIGALAALAGCSAVLGRSGPQTRSLGETQTSDGATVTITDAVAQKSFLRTLVDPFWEPIQLGPGNYVFAYLEVSGDSPPAAGDFRLVWGQDESVRGTANPEVSPSQRIHEREPRYAPEDGVWSGWIAFAGEIADAEDAYIEWENNRWALPDDERAELKAGYPAFEYGAIEVPDEIQSGEPLEVEVELQNVNDSFAGVCRGALHVLDPRPRTASRPRTVTPADTAQRFEVSIEPGQTTSWTTTFQGEFTETISRLELLLESHAGQREFTVNVA